MLEWLSARPSHWPAVVTLLSWGAAELALRLRLAVRPGWRARLRTWSAAAGGRLREWSFFVVVLAIAAAVIGALWLVRLGQFAIGGGRLTVIAGEVVALAGITLRIWAILTLDQFFTFVVGIADNHRVVEHGPYRWLRHPGYAGALLALLGIGIALRNWLSLLLIVAVPMAALAIRIMVEEATLARALGPEYRSYADRTARLIPGLWLAGRPGGRACPGAEPLARIRPMRYVMSNKWSLTEHFVITDDSGNPRFDVRGKLSLTQHLTFRDQSGQEVAEIRKHVMTTAHDILIGGQRVAEVRHSGFFGERYEIDSTFGQFTAKGSFTGWDYTISHGGQLVATISREFAFREKFAVQTADGGNDLFILAIVLAIDSIHDERRERQGPGFGGGFGGMAGGNFP